MGRVLVVCPDVVGSRMAGPAIRSTEFARLLADEHNVTLAAPPPLTALDAPCRMVEARNSIVSSEAMAADVVVVQGPAFDHFPGLVRVGSPIVVDLYAPYVLENLEVHSHRPVADRLAMHDHDLRTMTRPMQRGDLFLCASERQRGFWLGALTALGRVNPLTYEGDPELRRLLDVVPFGLPDHAVRAGGKAARGVLPGVDQTSFVLLWGGGIWNWFDPLTLLRAVAIVKDQHPNVRLLMLAGPHPNPSIAPMRMASDAVALARDLGIYGKEAIFVDRWIAYGERDRFLAEADVGVSLHLPTIETTFSFRTRILDYLWAGLPMLVTDGDSMAELVRDERLGCVVAPVDVDSTVAALRKLIEDVAFREDAGRRALLVSERFRWSRVAQPLLEYCRQPSRSADAYRGSRPSRLRRTLAIKAWHSLRDEGARQALNRGYRYVRKRFS